MEGLQIEKYGMGAAPDGTDKICKDSKGKYCLFSDAEKFHTIANDKVAENMLLATERDELRSLLREMVKCHDHDKPKCNCAESRAAKAALGDKQ